MPRIGVSLLFPCLVFGLPLKARPAPDPAVARCAAVDDKAARLDCYDALFRPPLTPDLKPVVVAPPEPTPDSALLTDVVPPAERHEEPCDTDLLSNRPVSRSPWAYRWDLDRCEKTVSVLLPHKTNYLLPFSWSRAPDPTQTDAKSGDYKSAEARFQYSLKLRLLDDLFGTNGDLWGAYSQKSFWQVYSPSISSPFRETQYEPELIMSFRTPYQLGRLQGRYLNLAFNHQSNGRGDEWSRSWNRLSLEAGIDGEHYAAYIKPWWRVKDATGEDENPNIEDWVGRIELMGAYQWQKQVFSLTWRNNLDRSDNRSSLQFGWTYPLTDRIKGYVQYQHGYGDSLIDYQQLSRTIGIGVLLGDWL